MTQAVVGSCLVSNVTQFLSATPLKLLNRISWNLVDSKDIIGSCAYYPEIWSPKFCGSNAPLNLKISPNILLKQLVSATPLQLLNRISWTFEGSKATICSCAYYEEMLIPKTLWELCHFEFKKFPKYTSEAPCQRNSSETTEQNFMNLDR
jgi:hypothetical protein